MDRASRVRVTGPLAPYASEFQGQLLVLNYTPASAAAHLILMSQLSRWLEAQRLAPRFLTPALFERFLIYNRAQGHRFPKSARGAQLLVTFLRNKGIVPEAPGAALSPTEEVLERFRRYLVNERGLADGTIFNHLHAAKLFFNSLDGDISAHLDKLDPPSVQRFILAESRCRSVASTKCLVSGLRSLLRFLHVDGTTDISLAGAVPTVAGWTGTWLPRGVDPESVHCLLASCDRATPRGAGTMPSSRSSLAWGCASGKSPHWSWATLIGSMVSWWCGARPVGSSASRCRPTSVRRWPITCGTAGPRVSTGSCSSGCWPLIRA